MEYILIDKLADIHINNLNNIQKVISRLSNIGYTIFSLAITFSSISFPLIYTFNIELNVRLILTAMMLVILLSFFISHLVNLKNERLWVYIYSDKIKMNILDLCKENSIIHVLKVDFRKCKKEKIIRVISCVKSWWTICWLSIILFNIITFIILFFIY